MIETCTRDESLYPPRCCTQPFVYDTFVHLLSSRIRAAFDAKRVELDVPSASRIYCPWPTCSAFLGCSESSNSGDLVCGECGVPVCSQCRQPSHSGENCAENAGTLAVRELARTERWQTCPGCSAIVELNIGCYHMTCRCRTQFCYLCAIPWKGCECPQWAEERLLEVAQFRVEQEMEDPVEALVYHEHVQEMANVLRSRHDCDQHQWSKQRRSGQCEECHDFMPLFVMVASCYSGLQVDCDQIFVLDL